jgi:uncharacterized damage-inducible protein DinB
VHFNKRIDMSRIGEIQELYTYNRWATSRILEATSALTDEQYRRDLGNSFPSVSDTLLHIVTSEWIWLSRWEGTSPRGMPAEWNNISHEQLRAVWTSVQERQSAFLDSLTEPQLDAPISYTSTAGQPFTSLLWQMLRHVVNHSTYHRGQLTTMLRQLGAGTISTDLILFFRVTVNSVRE